MTKSFTLDAGHGGNDPGAGGNGVTEKAWTLDFVNRLKVKLEKGYGAKVFLSRSTDTYVALGERDEIAKANQCAGFFSFHNNSAAAASANGYESYRHPDASGEVSGIQNTIHEQVMAYLNSYDIKNRGMKIENFQVLRECTKAKIPALLFENLFVSNIREAALLKSAAFVDGLADAYARGIARSFGLLYLAGAPTLAEVDSLAADIKILQAAGMINSPDYWLENARPGGIIKGENARALISNMAVGLRKRGD